MHATDSLEAALDAFVACESALTDAEKLAKNCLADATWRPIDPEEDEYSHDAIVLELHNRTVFAHKLVCLDIFNETFLSLRAKFHLHMNSASELLQGSKHAAHGEEYKNCLNIYSELERMLEIVTSNSYGFRLLDEVEERGDASTEVDALPFLEETIKGSERAKSLFGMGVESQNEAANGNTKETVLRISATMLDYFPNCDLPIGHRVRTPMEFYKSTRHQVHKGSPDTTCGARLRMLEDRAIVVKAVRILGVNEAEKFLAQEIRDEGDNLIAQEERFSKTTTSATDAVNADKGATGLLTKHGHGSNRGSRSGSSTYLSVPRPPDQLSRHNEAVKSPSQAGRELKERQVAVEKAIAKIERSKNNSKTAGTGVSLKEVLRWNLRVKRNNIVPVPIEIEQGRDEIKAPNVVAGSERATGSASLKDIKISSAGGCSKQGIGENGDEHGNSQVEKNGGQDNKQANGQADEHEAKHETRTSGSDDNGTGNGSVKPPAPKAMVKEERGRLLKMIDSRIVHTAILLEGVNEEYMAQEETSIEAVRDRSFDLLTQMSNLVEMRRKAASAP